MRFRCDVVFEISMRFRCDIAWVRLVPMRLGSDAILTLRCDYYTSSNSHFGSIPAFLNVMLSQWCCDPALLPFAQRRSFFEERPVCQAPLQPSGDLGSTLQEDSDDSSTLFVERPTAQAPGLCFFRAPLSALGPPLKKRGVPKLFPSPL